MSNKGARQVLFVCAGLIDNNLIAKTIPAASKADANNIFQKEYNFCPQETLGPFYKKRQNIEPPRELRFSNKTKKAQYKDWLVTAFILEDPKDQAYLVFLKKIDGSKAALPSGVITVPITDLRFI
jgi:hypothetical protein